MTEKELAARWKDKDGQTDGETNGDHPAGEIRLRDRWYGVRAAVLAGVTLVVAVGGVTTTSGTFPGTTTTGP
jgi:hypothetical protein